MSTFADLCGRSGTGSGPGGRGCNLFQPGTLTGITPQYVQYDSGNPGYDTDWNNFAPRAGVAWRPNVQDGWLRVLLGDPDLATVRAGTVGPPASAWTLHESLQRTPRRAFLNAREAGNLVCGQLLVTLSQQTASASSFPAVRCPAVARRRRHQHLRPAIKVPNTRSWSVGVQRDLETPAVDVRYVGAARQRLDAENWNEINVFKTVPEQFTRRGDLRAHVATGCGTVAPPVRLPIAVRHRHLPTYLAKRANTGRRAGHAGARPFPTARGRGTSASTSRIPSTRATICTPTRRSAPTRWRPASRRTSSE
jgi:hypothetical protein